ncbi:MAG TPA: glutamine synthetase family protein [Pseudonocardiaceae bacterium]|jgi:glutamine synthetase|nr:glutamine synthetase family protein [Pseudonocardiaceae bacterium]
MDAARRDQLFERAGEKFELLGSRDVVAVAITWVDNSGITRVKSVPLTALPTAAAWGVGASPVFDVFLLDDTVITGRFAGGPTGDLRLHPDLDRLTVLAAQPGWAWAPADRYDQEGNRHPLDQRGFAQTVVDRLADNGYTARAGFEIEWAVGRDGTDEFVPATTGPAYGHTRQVELSDYGADLLRALVAQGVPVVQFHPEYAAGQFEVSTAAEDVVGAADTAVLVRETIRAVSARHGLRASFSPKVLVTGVGNGGHLHVSLWRHDTNLFTGGDGRFGMTREAEAFSAGILDRLPALCAIGSPSVASYLRLVPSHWAGAFTAWGLENRETALRLISGTTGGRSWAANLEIKSFDQTANPYLVVAATLTAGAAGIAENAELPPPIDSDPATLSDHELDERGVRRLPESLAEAVAAFEADPALTQAFGTEFAGTIVDVRRGEIERFAGCSPEEIVAITRWRH